MPCSPQFGENRSNSDICCDFIKLEFCLSAANSLMTNLTWKYLESITFANVGRAASASSLLYVKGKNCVLCTSLVVLH